jgi:hypothetical protein
VIIGLGGREVEGVLTTAIISYSILSVLDREPFDRDRAVRTEQVLLFVEI